MVLARDSLECGEKEVFLSYLELNSMSCLSREGRRLLPRWTEMAEMGEIPIFGRNLRY